MSFPLLFYRHLGLDLVPRKEFEMVDPDQFSVSDLYKMVSDWPSCVTDCTRMRAYVQQAKCAVWGVTA